MPDCVYIDVVDPLGFLLLTHHRLNWVSSGTAAQSPSDLGTCILLLPCLLGYLTLLDRTAAQATL